MKPRRRRDHLRRVLAPARHVDIDPLIAPLRADPAHTAIFMDIDGTLANIVNDPTAARIPPPTKSSLRRLAVSYAEVAVVSGRRPLDSRRLVGLDLDYSGNHGIEHLPRGAAAPVIDPQALPWLPAVRAFVASECGPALTASGVHVEDKEIVITLHWRGARDEKAAEVAAMSAAATAAAGGLHTMRGRGVVEITPPIAIDKGTAVRRVLDENPGIRHVIYAGDDRTDANAMRALADLRASGRLDTVVRVGVMSNETPLEVLDNADILVSGTRGVRRVLHRLELRRRGPHLPLGM